jgi:MFS family permease
VVGVLLPAVGWVLDRVDVRWLMALGLTLLASAGLLASMANGVYAFVAIYGALGGAGYACTIGVPTQVYVTSWFDRNRGLALSILGNASFVGLFALSPLLAAAPRVLGWQGTFRALAAVSALVLLPLVLLGLRPRRGAEAIAARRSRDEAGSRPASVVAQFADPVVLTVSACLLACGFDMGVVDANLVPMMHDGGLDASGIAGTMSLFGAVAGCGGILVGYISDRLGTRLPVMAGLFSIRVLSLGALLLPIGPWRCAIFACLFGMSYAGLIPIGVAALADRADRRVLGVVIGLALQVHQVGGSVSAYLGGLDYDLTGGYRAYVALAVALSLLAALVLAQVARLAPRRARPQPEPA